jgi:transcriptional regulator with XRE-family HTH domain
MGVDESSARARELGSELKRFREQAKLSGSELARLAGWSSSKLCRMENGKRGASEVDVAIYLAKCGAPKRDLDALVKLASGPAGGYGFRPHQQRMSLEEKLRPLVVQETLADAVTWYEVDVVPGLLQTEDYIRALFRHGHIPDDDFEERVRARLNRQQILRRTHRSPHRFFVHEHGLRAMIGGARVMHEQLLRLVLASSWAGCEIRVVPAANAPFGIFGGSFALMEFVDHRPLVYLEIKTAKVFLEESEDVASYRRTLGQFSKVALNERDSREWLAVLADQYDRADSDCLRSALDSSASPSLLPNRADRWL